MPSLMLRVGLRPCLLRPRTLTLSGRTIVHVGRKAAARGQRNLPFLLTATSTAGVALGVSCWTSPHTLHCDDVLASYAEPPLPPPPKSSVNVWELTFGTACGVCAGVFVKKSARMVAFFFGGLFVVLQYLGSVNLVKVDWARMASRFENLFYTTDTLGNRGPPTLRSIWKWMVDFLTADFQPRASFVAGLALGLRVG